MGVRNQLEGELSACQTGKVLFVLAAGGPRLGSGPRPGTSKVGDDIDSER
jgi:hypothetical protein